MNGDSRISFEVKGKCVAEFKDGEWVGSYQWNPSPITLEETGMSEPCAELLHRYVAEYGNDVSDGTQLKNGITFCDFAARDGVRSFGYGKPEIKEEANSQMMALFLVHYRRYKLCASEVRIVSNTENHN